MTFQIPVRVTRTAKCQEGFYLLINGSRLRFRNKRGAIDAVRSLLALQRIQILTVREFAHRKRKAIARQIENATRAHSPAVDGRAPASAKTRGRSKRE